MRPKWALEISTPNGMLCHLAIVLWLCHAVDCHTRIPFSPVVKTAADQTQKTVHYDKRFTIQPPPLPTINGVVGSGSLYPQEPKIQDIKTKRLPTGERHCGPATRIAPAWPVAVQRSQARQWQGPLRPRDSGSGVRGFLAKGALERFRAPPQCPPRLRPPQRGCNITKLISPFWPRRSRIPNSCQRIPDFGR